MLSWEELLSSAHFPRSSFSNANNQPTKEIIDFLKDWSLSDKKGNNAWNDVESILVAVQDLNKVPPFDSRTSTKPIVEKIRKLQGLKNLQSPVWDTYAAISTKIELLEGVIDSSEFCSTIVGILQILEIFTDSSLLFSQLSQEPLSSGIGIEGSLHCAPFLASLISLSRTENSGEKYNRYKTVLDELRVSCSILSSLIFLIFGALGCWLPHWSI